MSDRLSKLIQSEIDQINDHLPAKAIPLRILDKMETPGVRLRDGTFQELDKEELEKIKKLIPRTYWGHVLLPIYITRRRDLGGGAYQVGGSKENAYIIQSVFEDLPIYEAWRLRSEHKTIYYKPEIRKIRQVFKTTTVIAFA